MLLKDMKKNCKKRMETFSNTLCDYILKHILMY